MMKFAATLAIAALLIAPAAWSRTVGADQPQQNCIAVGSGASRVAAVVGNPADCCSGRMQCSQYLSTTVVVKPMRDLHT